MLYDSYSAGVTDVGPVRECPRVDLRGWTVAMVLILGFAQPGWGMLAWETTEATRRPGPLEESVTTTFQFRNTGDKSVEILDVKSNCGCTTARSDKTVYAPGESGEVTATLNIGSRQGLQVTAITVSTNDGEKPMTLIVKTLIPEVLRIRPTVVVWPKDAPLDPKVINIHVQQMIGFGWWGWSRAAMSSMPGLRRSWPAGIIASTSLHRAPPSPQRSG